MNILKKIIKYLILLVIGYIFLKHAYKDLSFQELKKGLLNTDFNWIIIAFLFNIVNHYFRALRWQNIIKSGKHDIPIHIMFISEMSGFFANLFIPRIGEYIRCRTLKKMSSVPISNSIITVVIERFFDLTSFVVITLVSVIIYGKQIMGGININYKYIKLITIAPIISVIIFTIVLYFTFKFYKTKIYDFTNYIKSIIYKFKTIFRPIVLTKIIFYTFLVWFFYFLAGYLIFKSSPSTKFLKIKAGIAVFITSNIGMATPVQGGGAGAFHNLVAAALSIFHIDKKTAILYATLSHAIQFLTAFVVGGIAFIASFFIRRKKKSNTNES